MYTFKKDSCSYSRILDSLGRESDAAVEGNDGGG